MSIQFYAPKQRQNHGYLCEHNTDIKLILLSNNMQKKYTYDILTEIRSFCDVPIMVIMENNESEPQSVCIAEAQMNAISEEIFLFLC